MKVLFLSIFLTHAVLGHKLYDQGYEKHEAYKYTTLYGGIKSTAVALDPLRVPYIDGSLPELRYILRNVDFYGMKNCHLKIVDVNTSNTTFQFYLECPHIETHGDYELIGYIDKIFVEGEGKLIATGDNYTLRFYVNFEKKQENCHEKHIELKNYFLDAVVTGRVTYDFENLYYGKDNKKANEINEYLNCNWKKMDIQLRSSTLYVLMDVFEELLNDTLKNIPYELLFPGEH